MRYLKYFVPIVTVWIGSKFVISETCYDASTHCTNGWEWSPISCHPSSAIDIIHDNYCYPNDIILWRNGIMNSASASVPTDIMIDYDFIICQQASFSSCGYVPLQDSSSSQCGEVSSNSGVIFGTGIDLAYQTNETLSALGASSETLNILSAYYGLTGSIAADAICNQPFTINATEAYHLTIGFIDQYVSQVQQWYEIQRGNDTLSFMELPIGIRTVMTSIHWRWGHYTSYASFWSNIITNNFQSAITVLRSWYRNGATDQRLSSEANVLEASLGCVAASNNLDVVFLLDASGSVGIDDFERALNWTLHFIQYFDESNLNSQSVRFGLATFSSRYTDHIFLDQYTNVNEYKKHILSNVGYDSASTNLGEGLKQIGIHQFNTGNGMRESSKGVARLLVVLTDGISHDDVDEGITALNHLNLNIIAIGIGSYDMDQLEQITISENIYGIDTYTDLNVILSGITSKACHVPTQLNTENNAIVKDIVIQKHEAQYFEIYLAANDIAGSKNIVLNITQSVGCIYIYVSNSIQYPSYFEHDVRYTSCSQRFKQIVLASNATNIFISIEGRDDVNAIYDMNIGECNKTTCAIGSNYDPSLNDDSPYSSEPMSSCTDDINCDASDDTLNIEAAFALNDNIVHNINNMECFLYDALQSFVEPVTDSFGSCNIIADDIYGGQIDTLCQYPPCLWRDESDTIFGRRLNALSQCFDVNLTMNIYTNSIQISQYIQEFKNNVTESITAQFSNAFDICVYAQAMLHLLDTQNKETSEPQMETELSAFEAPIYAEISQQAEVTKAPIFVVSMLLGTVIFIWASLHFICSGVDLCKNLGVGDFDEVKKGIWWRGRSKFMSSLSIALIAWELADFILDLVAMIGIFVKSGNEEIDSALYISCGVVSLFAFVASVLLFIGKVYLWKTFYPTINVKRAEKKQHHDAMIDLQSKNQSESIQYKNEWRKYYKNQVQIGEYLGHLIMYDLFGVALEDCIQITVTWYIKQDLLFSGDSGFFTIWLWFTFIASLVSAAVKVFRALLLNLGCHHDSYQAHLKPQDLDGLIKDLQPFYVDSAAPLIVTTRNKIVNLKTKYRALPTAASVNNDDDDDDAQNSGMIYTQLDGGGATDVMEEETDCSSFCEQLKQLDASSYEEMQENEWKPVVDKMHTKYKRYILRWALEQLLSKESETIVTKEKKEKAINEIANKENQRIINVMNERKYGIDATKLSLRKDLSSKKLYTKLIGIQKNAYSDDENSNQDETKSVSIDKDVALLEDDNKYDNGGDDDDDDEVVRWFCSELKKSDTLYNEMKNNEWSPIVDEIQQVYEGYILDWIIKTLSEDAQIREVQKEKAMNEIAKQENERIVKELKEMNFNMDFQTYLNDNEISAYQLYPMLVSFQSNLLHLRRRRSSSI